MNIKHLGLALLIIAGVSCQNRMSANPNPNPALPQSAVLDAFHLGVAVGHAEEEKLVPDGIDLKCMSANEVPGCFTDIRAALAAIGKRPTRLFCPGTHILYIAPIDCGGWSSCDRALAAGHQVPCSTSQLSTR